MKSQNRAYLVDTHDLTFDERTKVKELLDVSCWMANPLAKNTLIYLAITDRSSEEFSSLPFPSGCIVTDVTGQDLRMYC